MDQYEVNPDDGDDADDGPPKIPDDSDKKKEMNYYGETQITLTQPTISQKYDRSDHLSWLNLDAMTSNWSFTQGGPKEDLSNKFEVGQQFQNKEEVMLAVKRYSIRVAAEYKIVESDQLSTSDGTAMLTQPSPTITRHMSQGALQWRPASALRIPYCGTM
ncbi:hypothetical protein AHAS_Ahas01G0030300 [Arachis hypogaea]